MKSKGFLNLPTWAKWVIAVVVLLALFSNLILCIGSYSLTQITKVRYGTKTVCKECGDIIKQDIHTKWTWKKYRHKYKVKTVEGLCSQCANKLVEVQTGVRYKCTVCGTIYKEDIKTKKVPFKDKDKYKVKTKTEGYCSAHTPKATWELSYIGDLPDSHWDTLFERFGSQLFAAFNIQVRNSGNAEGTFNPTHLYAKSGEGSKYTYAADATQHIGGLTTTIVQAGQQVSGYVVFTVPHSEPGIARLIYADGVSPQAELQIPGE